MAQARISINGVAGSSDDLPINVTASLSNVNSGGETSFSWSILSQPSGSADSLSSLTVQNPTLIPKKEGTYLLRVIVNQGLPTQQIDTQVLAVKQLKTRERIPAAQETTQTDTVNGWAYAVDSIFQRVDRLSADGVRLVGAASMNLQRGQIIRAIGSSVIKAGLPGQEVVPNFVTASATDPASLNELLAIADHAISGSNSSTIPSGSLLAARIFGRFAAAAVGTPSVVGQDLFVSDTATVSLSQGSNVRLIGSVLAIGTGSFDAWIDTTLTPTGSSAGGGGGGGSIAGLSGAYASGSSNTDETILLDSTRGPVRIRDRGAIGGPLFSVESGDGSTKYFRVESANTIVTGTLYVTGAFGLVGTFAVQGDSFVTGQSVLSGTNITGIARVSGALFVSGGLQTTGALGVSGPFTATGQTSLSGTTVVGTTIVSGALFVSGGLQTTGSLGVVGTFSATGQATLSGTNITGIALVSGALFVSGGLQVTGALGVSGPSVLSSSLVVGQSVVSGALIVSGGLQVTGSITATGNLAAGSATISGQTSVIGTTYLSGTTFFSGSARFPLLPSSSLLFLDALGNVTSSGDITVDGVNARIGIGPGARTPSCELDTTRNQSTGVTWQLRATAGGGTSGDFARWIFKSSAQEWRLLNDDSGGGANGRFTFYDATQSAVRMVVEVGAVPRWDPGADNVGNWGDTAARWNRFWAFQFGGVEQTIASSNTPAVTSSLGETIRNVLTGNVAPTFAAGLPGQKITTVWVQDSAGNHTASWPSNVKWGGNAPPPLTAASGSHDIFSFFWSPFDNAWREYARLTGAL